MLKLIGVVRKSGTFEGKPYDNVYLHCVDDNPFVSGSTTLIGGQLCETLKVSVANVRHTFGGLISSDADFAAMIGQEVVVSYNRYGNPDTISFADPAKEGGVKT